MNLGSIFSVRINSLIMDQFGPYADQNKVTHGLG